MQTNQRSFWIREGGLGPYALEAVKMDIVNEYESRLSAFLEEVKECKQREARGKTHRPNPRTDRPPVGVENNQPGHLKNVAGCTEQKTECR